MSIDSSFLSIRQTSSSKGLAIILVMLCHIGPYYHAAFLSFAGQIGVSIFLIVSGFGLNESFKKKGLINFWPSKIVRVLIPYWIVICLFDFWRLDFIDFAKLLFLIGPFHWFVSYIILYYFLGYKENVR